MLDFSWPELLVIIAIAVLVVGPKELPQIMRVIGRFVRKVQYMRFSISRHFDEIMNEADLDRMRRDAEKAVMGDIQSEIDDDEDYLMQPLEIEDDSETGKSKAKTAKKTGSKKPSRKMGRAKDSAVGE